MSAFFVASCLGTDSQINFYYHYSIHLQTLINVCNYNYNCAFFYLFLFILQASFAKAGADEALVPLPTVY